MHIFAFIGSVLTTILVYMISRTGGRLPAATLLLTGVAFHFLMSAGINFLLMFNREMADRVVLWNMGSFSNSSWTSVAITVPVVVVCSIIIIFNAKNLNILSVDEPYGKITGCGCGKKQDHDVSSYRTYSGGLRVFLRCCGFCRTCHTSYYANTI